MPHATPARSSADPNPRADFPEINARLVELGLVDDEEFVTGILSEYVRDSQILLVDLHVAVASRDVKTCERLAHRLKGSSLNLGAGILAETALEIEKLARSGDLSGAPVFLGALARDFTKVAGYLERKFGAVRPPAPDPTR